MPLVSELLERFEASDGAKTRFLNFCFDVRDTLQQRDLQDRFKAGQKETGVAEQSVVRIRNRTRFLWDAEGAARSPHPHLA